MTAVGGQPESAISIHEPAADEWDVWRDLRFAALRDSPHAFASGLERESAYDEDFWRRRLGDPQNVCLIALVDGRAVGIGGGYLREDERGSNGVIAELVSMWVRPDQRRIGVARALIGRVSQWAHARGQDELRLFVSEGNDAAQRTYERLGFTLNGYRQPQPHDPSRFESEMSKPIGPGAE